MRQIVIIRKPVAPDGNVIQDDSLIEILEFGSFKLKFGDGTRPSITIELAQHTDGLWMWSTSIYGSKSGYGYRLGPKWGKFARTRNDAIIAACNELAERNPGPEVMKWLESLAGSQQQELFV